MSAASGRWADPDVIRRVLQGQVWAVVGLSGDQARPAFGVAWRLQQAGKRVVPVHPAATEVLGERVYPSLAEIPFDVDVVDLFRRSEEVGVHVDEAVDAGVRAVWLQEGVIDEAAAERASAAGLDVVMDRCAAVEIALQR